VHQGPGFVIGQISGAETVTLAVNQIPAHAHVAQGQSAAGNQGSPAAGVWAQSNLNQFSTAAANSNMNANLIQPTGGNQPHDNMMPYLVVSFIISLFGVFPSQN
jgi:microcystin-dependent protein